MKTTALIPAVGYARRSTDLQERSIPDQKIAVERWAGQNGYKVVRWYVDDAVSGTSARGRDQFAKLLADAGNGRDFEAVLCYDMSRFSRGGTSETGYYLHTLRLAGVETVFTSDGIPEGDEGELIQGVKSWQARQYSVKLSRDSIRGQHSTVTVRRSSMGGRAPYGYDRQYVTIGGQVLKTVRTLADGRREEFGPDGRHLRYIDANEVLPKKTRSDIVRLVPGNPNHIAVVREIFRLSAAGNGFRSIVIALESKGIPGPMQPHWNQQAVKSILRNPCYRGALAWNRRTYGKIHGIAADGSPIPKKVPTSTRNPAERWIVVEGAHEPIVSEELFKKAQEQMARRRDKGGQARPNGRYLLSGLLRCTHCGFNFWGCRVTNKAGVIRYYADAGYRARGISVCKATHIQAAALDNWVLEQIRAVVRGDTAIQDDVIDRFVRLVASADTEPNERDDKARELAEVTRRIGHTVALLANPELQGIGELTKTLAALQKRRVALEASPSKQGNAPTGVKPGELRAWAKERLGGLAGSATPGAESVELRAAVHAFVHGIEVDPKREVGVLYLPKNALDALHMGFVSMERSASSTHSWMVEAAERWGSPR